MINYPIKFEPILKEKIWGGTKLKDVLSKNTTGTAVGESWEISDVSEDAISVVANGALKGLNLKELLQQYTTTLLGKQNYDMFGTNFPLLIKFIDANTNLSIQVHPDDAIAKTKHDSFGKTEMWYVMQADEDANVIVGFNEEVSKETYTHAVQENTLETIVQSTPVTAGDSFFINAGKIHAIGAGVLVAEIQQTSDITYRIYDWNRKDAQGQSRELHTDLALEAIDFSHKEDYYMEYDKTYNHSSTIASCPYFTTNFLPIKYGVVKNYTTLDSFVIYMCTKGYANITVNHHTETIYQGETILIPATAQEVIITADEAELLEVYI